MDNLTEIIKSRIRDYGPITFAEFMERALYDPAHGYYSLGNRPIGREGDFYTSPHVHKAFGSVIGNFIIKSFNFMNEEGLSIIELGAGRGILALDILDHIKTNNPKQYARTNYYLVEQSNDSRNESKKILEDHIEKVCWFSSLSEIDNKNISGVIISNELFDALPFHRLKITKGNLSELYITLDDRGDLSDITDKPSCKELIDYFNKIEMDFAEDQEFEINLKARTLLNEIDRVIRTGFILTIDYGYLADELFNSERMKGTFKCIHNHTINETPYINIGQQDITAHVDFSNLIRTGESLNIKKVKYTTQGQFLIDWGVLDLIGNDLEQNDKLKNSLAKDIQAIKNLFLPELMGDKFKVLVQEKNLSEKINNFYPQSPFKISFKVL